MKLTLRLLQIAFITAVMIFCSFVITDKSKKFALWFEREAKAKYAQILLSLPHYDVVRGADSNTQSVESILDKVSYEMEFDPVVLRAMAIQESGGYTETNRVREELQLREVINPPSTVNGRILNQVERTMWISSHGVLQIIFGFHYKTCGLQANEWDKLYNPLINIRCGATILKNNLKKYHETKEQSQRLWLALRDFNGSGRAAKEYADSVMSHITLLRKKEDFGRGV